MVRHISFPLAGLFGLLSRSVASEATELCGILDQRSAIVGYNLYFSSGNYTFNDNQTWHNTSSFYVLPLDKPFDLSGPIPLDLLEISPLPSDELAGGMSPIAGGAAGTFFYDHTTLYAYGGIIGGNANGTQNGLWTYNITDRSWGLTIVEGGALRFGDDTEGCFANDPSQSLSFYTGGWDMAYNNTNNGIVRFDSSDSFKPQWNFETAQGGTMQGPDILKGSMQFVRKGQAGILVAFGGYNTTHKGTDTGAGLDWDEAYMSDIFVYDIFSNVWYLVKATGQLPSSRIEFCTGVSSAPDDSSFSITMHGGFDQFYGDAFDDVYVLVLPAFYWVQVDAQNDPDNGVGRNKHECSMYYAQMIVSGGGISGPYCNRSHPPIKVLDTSTYVWQSVFNPNNIDYIVPQVVIGVVGGSSSGGAIVTQPHTGWQNPALAEIFSHTLPRDTYVYPNGSSSNNSTSNNSTSSSSATSQSISNNTGAIAGGVVGGVVVMALIGLAIWFFTWRPKHRKDQQDFRLDNKAELPGQGTNAAAHLDPVELEPQRAPVQLETRTDRAELDAYQYAVAMQGVQSPVELDARNDHLNDSSEQDQIPP